MDREHFRRLRNQRNWTYGRRVGPGGVVCARTNRPDMERGRWFRVDQEGEDDIVRALTERQTGIDVFNPCCSAIYGWI